MFFLIEYMYLIYQVELPIPLWEERGLVFIWDMDGATFIKYQ